MLLFFVYMRNVTYFSSTNHTLRNIVKCSALLTDKILLVCMLFQCVCVCVRVSWKAIRLTSFYILLHSYCTPIHTIRVSQRSVKENEPSSPELTVVWQMRTFLVSINFIIALIIVTGKLSYTHYLMSYICIKINKPYIAEALLWCVIVCVYLRFSYKFHIRQVWISCFIFK